MTLSIEGRATSQVLAEIGALLDSIDSAARRMSSDGERLSDLRAAVRLAGRCQALAEALAAEASAADSAGHSYGTSITTWLVGAALLTPREAGALVHSGTDLASFPVLHEATSSGSVLPQQARAITRVLGDLPTELRSSARESAEQQMVAFAASHNSAELGRLSRYVLEVVAPEIAEESEARRLERDCQTAQRQRHLGFTRDGQSLLFSGSLPLIEGEAFVRLIDAHAASLKRAIDALDPRLERTTPGQRRADALMAMIRLHQQQAVAPSHGGDRPRVVVTIDYDRLLARCLEAKLVSSDEQVSAGDLRRLACDADILPMVLSGGSLPLDVGRTQRLVTGPIRAALEIRDGGCVFPGCDKPPQACEAHHVVPWWAGGPTALWNLVLLCPHHHGTVEPSHDPNAQRWEVRLRPDGVSEVLPPAFVDPTRRPRIHTRLCARHRTAGGRPHRCDDQ